MLKVEFEKALKLENLADILKHLCEDVGCLNVEAKP